MARLALIFAVAVLATSCAGPSGSPGSRYDGVYELTSTPTKDYESVCPTDQLKVRVVDGRLNFTVHPPDEWRGYIDSDGYFHGESAYGARTFKLTEGIRVPGDVQRSTLQEGCEYFYKFTPVR
jgi:hypothetical protein